MASVLVYGPPTTEEVTFTATVQVPGVPPGIVRPAGNVTVVPPAAATSAPAPPQVVMAFGVGAITTLAGRVSIKGAVRVAAPTLSLLNVIVSLDTPPALMVVGAKTLPSATPPGSGIGVTNGAQVGTVVVLASVVTVPPKAKARPVKFAKCPSEIPALSMMVPMNVGVGDTAAFAPSVVAPVGVQNTSDSQAPPVATTFELAPVVSAPAGLKM